jgi:hypothetical protein|tara:strand:- start:226 stop:468 length:243 start_codon:yes stop_codon:yes gene_type:complete
MKNLIWSDAIKAINPDAKYTCSGDLENIIWLDGTPAISKSDIETKLSELQTTEITNIASAKAKLKGLGLTDAELTALFGD